MIPGTQRRLAARNQGAPAEQAEMGWEGVRLLEVRQMTQSYLDFET